MQATKPTDKLSSNNLLMVLLLVSLLIVGATALVAKSLIQGIVRDSSVLSKMNAAESILTKNLDSAPQLVSAYANLSVATRATLTDALPTTSDFPGLIVALENISSDSGSTLKNVSPGQVSLDPNANATAAGTVTTTTAAAASDGAVPVPAPKTYNYTIAFDGTYASLQKFLGDLELYTRPMRVTSLKLSGSGTALSGTVDVQTFYQDKASLPFGKETVK
jgi:hypothetical protein